MRVGGPKLEAEAIQNESLLISLPLQGSYGIISAAAGEEPMAHVSHHCWCSGRPGASIRASRSLTAGSLRISRAAVVYAVLSLRRGARGTIPQRALKLSSCFLAAVAS